MTQACLLGAMHIARGRINDQRYAVVPISAVPLALHEPATRGSPRQMR